MADIKVGELTHYYDKIGVGVVELSGDLAVGDDIKFVRGGEELFTQKVVSMQAEHQNLEKAEAGQAIGLKIDQEVKEGAEVFKV
ncbi:hypothetical protein HY404_00295 [Candidatus Microgenomates bacterium]|nr:hypothetical protein [Candidatus Microgenomates bacterium]